MFNLKPTNEMYRYLSKCTILKEFKNNSVVYRKNQECKYVF